MVVFYFLGLFSIDLFLYGNRSSLFLQHTAVDPLSALDVCSTKKPFRIDFTALLHLPLIRPLCVCLAHFRENMPFL